jgi:hypothetical protein
MFVPGNIRPLLGDRTGFSAGVALSRSESWKQRAQRRCVEAELPERRSEQWRSDSDLHGRFLGTSGKAWPPAAGT